MWIASVCRRIFATHGVFQFLLEEIHDQLRHVLDTAKRNGVKIIVGGDFNTQLGLGHRGDTLQNLCSDLDFTWPIRKTALTRGHFAVPTE